MSELQVKKLWTGQLSLAGLIQIDRQFTLMLVPVGSFAPDLRVFAQREETPRGNPHESVVRTCSVLIEKATAGNQTCVIIIDRF